MCVLIASTSLGDGVQRIRTHPEMIGETELAIKRATSDSDKQSKITKVYKPITKKNYTTHFL